MMKNVLITGTNRGLGSSLLSHFVGSGWHVYATARASHSLPEHPQVTRLTLDLSDYQSIHAMAEEVRASGHSLDLIINNAGYNPKDSDDKAYFMSTLKIEHFSGENIARSLHINALAPLELTSQLLPCLASDGVVLNISSWLGSIGAKTSGGHYGYAGSKALLNMFTRAMALEFAEGERVAVAINPGWVRTDMGGPKAQNTPDDVARDILKLYDTKELHNNNGAFLNIDGSQHEW